MSDDSEPGGLIELGTDESWELLASRSIGRFAVNRHRQGPLVVPVNYVVDKDARSIVFRSGAGTKLNAVGKGLAVLQVDDVDTLRHTGWSVMVEGTTSWLYEEQDRAAVEPWAPGEHPYVVRITPTRVSGRRLHIRQLDPDPRGYR